MVDIITSHDEKGAAGVASAHEETDVVSAAAGGAAVGAVVGSFLEPGVGSVVGTIVGLAIGGGLAAFQRYGHF